MRTTACRAASASGFTLVEVLIALAILAVGLLGGVALLIAGLRANHSALQQTAAATLAADLAERIRANRIGGTGYALPEGTALQAPARTCAAIGECSPSDVAALDLYDWQQTVLAQLPDALTSIEVEPVTATSSHLFTIVVRWTEAGGRLRSAVVLTLQG